MDPSNLNGGVFLGVKGIVVKSHGGADARGVASALKLADNLARHSYLDEIAQTVSRVRSRTQPAETSASGPALDIEQEERAAS